MEVFAVWLGGVSIDATIGNPVKVGVGQRLITEFDFGYFALLRLVQTVQYSTNPRPLASICPVRQ